jgi:hypothetical protein
MNDRRDWQEELRFAKRQQWTVATATVTLLAALRATLSVLAGVVALSGFYILFSLQRHLAHARIKVDETDPSAWLRGTPICVALALVIVFAAAVVI